MTRNRLAAAIAAMVSPLAALAGAPVASIIVNATGDAGDGACGAAIGECTLRDAVLAAEADPDPSTIIFDPAVFGPGDTISLSQGELATSTNVTIEGSDLIVERDATLGTCVLDSSVQSHEFRLLTVVGGAASISALTLQGGCADGNLGGGIGAFAGDLTLSGVNLVGNSAAFGGGLYVSSEGSGATVVENSMLKDNVADIEGGGAFLRLPVAGTVTGTTFAGNTAGLAGGLSVQGDIVLSDAVISGNSAIDDAGGMAISTTGTSTLERVTFESNDSGRHGGALTVTSSGSGVTTVRDSTFANNSTIQEGGAIRQPGGTLVLQSTTLSGNTAGFGGALVAGAATVSDATFYQNVSPYFGELVGGAGVSVARTVFATSAANPCTGGPLITDSIATDGACGSNTATLAGLDLGPLADNGGATLTHLPGPESVLVDAIGGCAGTDQRGFIRPVDADGDGGTASCDYGAVELQNTLPTAVNDAVMTDQDTLATGNVLTNDLDADDDDAGTLTITALDGTAGDVGAQTPLLGGGAITLQADGSFIFDPLGDFDVLAAGDSQLTGVAYTISDGIAEATGTLEITVAGLNDAPVAGTTVASTTEDVSTGPIAYNASDIDAGDVLTFAISEGATGGVVMDNGDGTFTYDPNGAFESLDDGESDSILFAYSVTDTAMASSGAVQGVTINGVNDAPVAVDDSYVVTAGEILTVDIANGLLANDSDVDIETITVVPGIYTAGGVGGELDLNDNGSFSFTAPDAVGTSTFTYTVTDGDASDTGLLSIEVVENTVVDLQISKTDGVSVVFADDVLTYTIDVLNAGPSDVNDALVQDLVPPELGDVSWTCTPLGAAACGNGSGSGSIQELVDIPASDAVTFELTATVTDADLPIVNTATVTAPMDRTDSNTANNTATDTNFPDALFADGFEMVPMVKAFSARTATIDAETLTAIPDQGRPVLVLRAVDRGAEELAMALIHARRVDGRVELRISRLEAGEWVIGAWTELRSEAGAELRW